MFSSVANYNIRHCSLDSIIQFPLRASQRTMQIVVSGFQEHLENCL